MNKKLCALLSTLLLSTFVGCGALDDTKALTQQANEGVAHGNQLQEAMLEIQFKMLDYMQSTDRLMREMNAMTQAMKDQTAQMAQDTNENMAQSNALMKQTLEYMRMQAVGTSMQGLLDPDNTAELEPPTKMMPYADTLGKQATIEELTEFSYNLQQEFASPNGTGTASQKEIMMYAFSLVGGFMPQEKMETIIKEQIDYHGKREEMTYMLLVGRYEAIRDLLYEPVAVDAKVYNASSLKEAVDQFLKMKYLATLPYVSKLHMTAKVGVVNVDHFIDPNEIKTLGNNAYSKFNSKLTSQELAKPEVQALLMQFKS